MLRFLVWLVVLALVGGGSYWAYHRLVSQKDESLGGRGGAGGRPTFVVAKPVGQAEFSIRIDSVGTAMAKESIIVTAKTADTISRIGFADGQSVPQGYVIAEMTSRQQSAQLAEARASLAEAQNQFERGQTLASQGNISGTALDQRRAQRDTAAARVGAQESQVADRLIRAPFAGVLGLRQVSVGTLVRPGDVITTLDDVSVIKLDLAAPETAVSLLQAGMSVEARAAGFPDKVFMGVVAGIDSRVDPIARTVLLRAEIPNSDSLLKPGMLLSISLRADQRTSLFVSEESIVPLAQQRFVYVVGADGKAERRAVVTGRRSPGQVEILSGLRLGEMVVTEGVVKLRPDAPITLKPPGADGSGGGHKSRAAAPP